MSVIERTGSYGKYYGSPWGSSSPCNSSQMATNAKYIYAYLKAKGWTANAVAGLLGNMQAESSINPGRWQSDKVDVGPAYGIVQWDPHSKYINWCSEQGYSDPSEMDNNLARIIYELENQIQWYATSKYNFSFSEFATSKESPAYLGAAFVLNYERPADQSESVQNYRGSLATAWYEVIIGTEPDNPDPDNPDPDNPNPDNPEGGFGTFKRRKYKFILFKKRRYLYGQR